MQELNLDRNRETEEEILVKKLIIVESPTKARTIKSMLKGRTYDVKASKGHIRDLPKSKIGVDFDNNFEPKYITIRGKGDVISTLRDAVKKADEVYLATDPDREGEAISWHLAELLKIDISKPIRVEFHEITKEAITRAFENPRYVDQNLVDAQQARRILDRIVGYKLSPFLWSKVSRGLSAGRVQSVTVKLVVDREKERNAFVPAEYWTVEAHFNDAQNQVFQASLVEIAGDKSNRISAKETQDAIEFIKDNTGLVKNISESERKRNPGPPFITSTLQQVAARNLKFSARKTMQIAQQLYEGIKIDGTASGLITYMRTDSVTLSTEALTAAASYIKGNFGTKYYQRRQFKSKKNAQEAHEAIRPTDVLLVPDQISNYLTADQLKLYRLIWNRFLASQMKPALFALKTGDISIGDYLLRVSGSRRLFDGFLKVYNFQAAKDAKEQSKVFPDIEIGMNLPVLDCIGLQHFTEPPAQYTEASLIKELEDRGIGRPSTYAPTLDTVIKRRYITKEKGKLIPTTLAMAVTDLLEKHFTTIMDIEFTAKMEDELDLIADGVNSWRETVGDFYSGFAAQLADAEVNAERVQIVKEVIETDIPCPECGRNMVIREGRYGKFLACSGYPECKTTQPIVNKIGVTCLKCGGNIIERRSKKGSVFYGCDQYPACDFVTWDLPLQEACPKCGSNLTTKTKKDDSVLIKCSNKECSYTEVRSADA